MFINKEKLEKEEDKLQEYLISRDLKLIEIKILLRNALDFAQAKQIIESKENREIK